MEVNHYPFTTKQIHVGHFTHRRLQYQMVDTPGLLDRPMEERNHIEMQAIAALEHIGSLVLFLVDESESCGTPFEEQMNLLEEVKTLLPETELMVVSSKADLLDPPPPCGMRSKAKNRHGEIQEQKGNLNCPCSSMTKVVFPYRPSKTLDLTPCGWKSFARSRPHDPTTRWNFQRDGTVRTFDHIVSSGTIPNPSMPSLSVVLASSEIA